MSYGVQMPALGLAVSWSLSCPCFDRAYEGKRLAIQAVLIKNCARSTFATIPLSSLMSLYLLFPPPDAAKTCQHGQWRKVLPHVPGGLMMCGPVPVYTNSYTATLQGHACYPLINKDEQKTERHRALRSPSASSVGVNNDNTTQLSPLIKGYKQQASHGISWILYLCHSKYEASRDN